MKTYVTTILRISAICYLLGCKSASHQIESSNEISISRLSNTVSLWSADLTINDTTRWLLPIEWQPTDNGVQTLRITSRTISAHGKQADTTAQTVNVEQTSREQKSDIPATPKRPFKVPLYIFTILCVAVSIIVLKRLGGFDRT